MTQESLSSFSLPKDKENDPVYMKVEAEEEQPNTRSVVVKREAVTPQTQYKKLFSSISTSNVTKITKRTATIENAPIWRHYLSQRTQKTIEMTTTTTNQPLRRSSIKSRRKKRARADGNSVMDSSLSVWGSNETATRLRAYWETLSALERQQVLFLDEPELVKQLYKLNLSLLCVGLMQRHLKNPIKNLSSNSSIIQRQTKTQSSTSSDEKTYELLEAMEFMDIGTGILTVKSDLVEEPARLFDLVSGVCYGFLSTLHLLDEKQFLELFVKESEVISTWDEYQMLIGMLLEQLILKSYMNHLEKAATLQMEQLLLEEMVVEQKKKPSSSFSSCTTNKSLKKATEYTVNSTSSNTKLNTSTNSNKKQKQKTKSKNNHKVKITATVQIPVKEFIYPKRVSNFSQEEEMTETSTVSCGDFDDVDIDIKENNEEELKEHTENDTSSTEGEIEMEPCPDPEFDSSILQPEKKKKMKELYKEHTQVVNTMTVRTNAFRLNPNASVFEPQKIWSHETAVVSSSSSGKRKLDDFIINFSNQDLVFEEDEEECQYQDFTTQRIREEDAELEQSLREIYRSTSDMLGWDCLKNCEVSTNSSFGPEWDEKILMMTAPKQVVRHFTHSTLMDGKNVVDIDYITQEMKGWTGTPPSGAVLSHSRYYYPPNMLTSMSDLPSFVPLETGSFRMTDHTKASTHHSLHHTNPHPLSSSHRTVRSPPVPVLYPFPHQFEPVVKSLEDFLPHHHSETGKRHFSSSNNMNHHHHNASTCGSSLSSSQL